MSRELFHNLTIAQISTQMLMRSTEVGAKNFEFESSESPYFIDDLG